MMKKRTRKPPVEPAVAREWLRRNDEKGESAAEIARAAGYDVRTVKKQLDLMRQEREVKEARQVVLREALEKHYADLCALAEKLRAEFSGYRPSPISASLKIDPLRPALREHLPRSPIWRDIDRMERLAPEYEAALLRLRDRIQGEARLRTSLEFVPGEDKQGLLPGFINVVAYHLEATARGTQGLTVVDYVIRNTEFGVLLSLGTNNPIAMIAPDKAKVQKAKVEGACTGLRHDGLEWEEYADLAKLTNEFLRIKKELNEELTRVILKRVLPGRCIYCPFP